MAKKSEEPVTALATRPVSEQLPDYLRNKEVVGVREMDEYIRPPRLKVVQKMSKAQYSEFRTGDLVVASASPLLVRQIDLDGKTGKSVEQGPPFHFVPLFFYPEWVCWNPIELKGTVNAVHERTFDPNSQMVARAREPKLWSEVMLDAAGAPMVKDGKTLYRRYVEHLNFAIALVGEHELTGVPLILSYSRAAHKHGSAFAALIKTRKASIFANVFEGYTKFEQNDKGDWYSVVVGNPSEASGVKPFVMDEATHDAYQQLHMSLKEAHAKNILVTDYDETDVEGPTAVREY